MSDSSPGASGPLIQRWSTAGTSPSRRLDLYAEALTCAVDPMHVTSRRQGEFNAEVRSGGTEAFSVVMANASPHRCMRDEHEIAASGERCFHLILNRTSAWRLVHRGEHVLRPGDAVLLDSYVPHEIELPDFSITHLRMSASWARQWLSRPDALVGRVLPHDESWSRALTTFVSRLTPELLVRPPLPGQAMADHVGVTLALIANELRPATRRRAAEAGTQAARARRVVEQRFAEAGLRPEDVAREIGVSTRTLHRAFAAQGSTFGRELLERRLEQGMQLLKDPRFDAWSIDEIARHAGFNDGSQFGRALRLGRGVTPGLLRRDRAG